MDTLLEDLNVCMSSWRAYLIKYLSAWKIFGKQILSKKNWMFA
jgi:hypothetical protein